jgi:hypothetical protein
MYTIATLYQFKRHLGVDNTADDDRLLTTLEAALRHVERETGRRFVPYVASIAHDLDSLFNAELLLTADLLQLTSVTDADGAINLDDVTMLPPGRPASLLRVEGVFAWEGTPQDAVTVTGVWGWHDDPLAMWQETGDAVANALFDEDDTALSVSDADATYADGLTPRFSVGALLNIEDEFVRVLAVDTATDTLTVERGAGGSTAFAHAQGTPISVYRPPFDVLMTVLQVAAWFYHQPDSSAPLPPEAVRAMVALRRAVVRA